jgi:histidinol-phosphate aminotransferase
MSRPETLARPEILELQAYEHALWDPRLERLHANELPWRQPADDSDAGLNRYPEPQPRALLERLAGLYQVPVESVLVSRGSDEGIDLLIRSFCRAGQDRIVICPPTFGMYGVCANIQGAQVVSVPLQAADGFSLDAGAVLQRCAQQIKLVFLCSPNNPTGNLLDTRAVMRLVSGLEGRAIVVVDEAYVEFAAAPSLAAQVLNFPHLIVLRTLSKAYALAGARCGALIADPGIVRLLRKVIQPYSIPQGTLEVALRSLEPAQLAIAGERVQLICSERRRLQDSLAALPSVRRAWHSDANFILVECHNPQDAMRRARSAGLLIRDVRSYPGLERCVRITVGDPAQNSRLLAALQ